MIKRQIFTALIFFLFLSFLYFLIPGKVSAFEVCGYSLSYCQSKIGTPVSPYCCHTKAGCTTAQCGWFPWYSYCRASDCCGEYTGTAYCTGSFPYDLQCFSGWRYSYNYTTCPATDSCEGGPKLKCGLCLDNGSCGKCSGYYKQCCDNVTMAVCSHGCIGGNTTGTCGSGCQSVIAASCPGGGPTPTPGGGPTATPGGPTPTPSLPDCGNTCLDYGTASVAWPDCSCTRQSPASGYEIIGTWNSSDCPQCTGYRQIGVPTPTPRPPTPTPGGPTPTPTPTPTMPPVPSCTMSLSPLSLSIQSGKSAILTANVNLVNATVKQVNFTSTDTSIVTVNPSSVSSFPYSTNVYGVKAGSTTISAQTLLNPSGSCTAPSSTTVTVEAQAWFQTQGGDIHAQGSLTDKIPATATDLNLSLDLNSYPGVVSQKDGINLGDGFSSKSTAGNWVASSEYKGKPYGSFEFFKKKYAMQMVEENFDGSLSQQDGVYYSKSAQTLSGNWTVPASRWLVIIVEGDVTIPNNIKVNKGGFLAIASSGKITFDGSVTQAQGMFVAETIDTGNSTTAFAGEGIFAANTFDLNRDLADNSEQPAEFFVARPDFLMSSYKSKDQNLWWFFQKWQELAP